MTRNWWCSMTSALRYRTFPCWLHCSCDDTCAHSAAACQHFTAVIYLHSIVATSCWRPCLYIDILCCDLTTVDNALCHLTIHCYLRALCITQSVAACFVECALIRAMIFSSMIHSVRTVVCVTFTRCLRRLIPSPLPFLFKGPYYTWYIICNPLTPVLLAWSDTCDDICCIPLFLKHDALTCGIITMASYYGATMLPYWLIRSTILCYCHWWYAVRWRNHDIPVACSWFMLPPVLYFPFCLRDVQMFDTNVLSPLPDSPRTHCCRARDRYDILCCYPLLPVRYWRILPVCDAAYLMRDVPFCTLSPIAGDGWFVAILHICSRIHDMTVVLTTWTTITCR